MIKFTKEGSIGLGNKHFSLDAVFGPSVEQEELYDKCVKPIVSRCFEGYNATVLAYGQTGSGKSYTMGLADSSGLIPRVLQEIFITQECRVFVSFVEIYCEQVFDLLNKGEHISIRESGDGLIVDSKEFEVSSAEEAMEVLKKGCVKRSTGQTNVHEHSSRSHAIFCVRMIINGEQGFLESKLRLVDLAGSERLKKTKLDVNSQRFQESIKINSGLLALANVIRNLTTVVHQPRAIYRQSKLTRFLKDSLGGNSLTVMIACVTPNHVDFEETLNTVSYASRARQIKNNPDVNKFELAVNDSLLEEEEEEKREDEISASDELFNEDGLGSDEWWLKYKQALREKTIESLNKTRLLEEAQEEIIALKAQQMELEAKLEETCDYVAEVGEKLVDYNKEKDNWKEFGFKLIESLILHTRGGEADFKRLFEETGCVPLFETRIQELLSLIKARDEEVQTIVAENEVDVEETVKSEAFDVVAMKQEIEKLKADRELYSHELEKLEQFYTEKVVSLDEKYQSLLDQLDERVSYTWSQVEDCWTISGLDEVCKLDLKEDPSIALKTGLNTVHERLTRSRENNKELRVKLKQFIEVQEKYTAALKHLQQENKQLRELTK